MSDIQLKQLTHLSIDKLKRAIQMFFLRLRIRNYYMYLNQCKQDADEANYRAKYVTKMIVNAERELHDLEKTT